MGIHIGEICKVSRLIEFIRYTMCTDSLQFVYLLLVSVCTVLYHYCLFGDLHKHVEPV